MKISIKSATAVTALAMATVALYPRQSVADESPQPAPASTADDADQPVAEGTAGFAANMYFTDENGNRREPTAAEVKAAAEAFQKDLARLAGKHKGKTRVHKQPNGTVSATVATTHLEFLTVRENEDGTLTFGHSTMDEDGNVSFQPADDLPEM